MRSRCEAIAYVVPRTRATVPGAAETLRTLHQRGFNLFMASGDNSENLDGYLRGLGVRELFRETLSVRLGRVKPQFKAWTDSAWRTNKAQAI